MKILLFANTDWYLYNFRLPLAKALRARGADVTLLSPPGEYAARLQGEGFRWLAFPFERKGMNPLAELAAILRLRRLYRRERPDLVHHFTVKPVLYGSLAARLAGVPAVVNSITGLGYLFLGKGIGRRLLRTLARTLYRLSLGRTRVIFQNEDDRRAFLDLHLVRPEQADLVPGSGVDMTRFVPASEPDGTPVVLLAARLLWDKGVGEFVEAARQLTVRARFVLAGDPDADNPAAVPPEQLRAWQEEGVVEWQGWQDDMPTVLAGANIFCLPSYREGLSKTLAEAAACGRAIVTTDVPGCRDVVAHGVNGLLVEPRNADALAEAISALLADPSLRRKMGAAGRRIAEERFSIEHVVGATLAMYRQAGLKGLS
jgi:glycosyltransferase involved in cell wall biosynthesis